MYVQDVRSESGYGATPGVRWCWLKAGPLLFWSHLFNCPLTMTSSLSRFFKVLCIVYSSRLHVYRQLWLLDKLSSTCSNSTLRFDNSCSVPNQVVAF